MDTQYIKIDHEGNKFYYSDRAMVIRHKLNGPAVEWADGDKEWSVNGTLHRGDGPAIMSALNGNKWFLNGREVTEEEHAQLTLTINSNDKEFNVGVLNALINNGPLNKEIFNDKAGAEVW